MTTQHITIIGAGNMGTALLGGLIKKGYEPKNLWITDPDAKKLAHLQSLYQINTTNKNSESLKTANVVILAVKPQIFQHVISELASSLQVYQPLLLSIAAGITTTSIQQWLTKPLAIVRAMPNTPALINCGASALYANAAVSSQQRQIAEAILCALGITVWLEDENLMNAVTALSGSGPAYFFLIIEALQDAAQELGLPADIAKLLTLQTAYGATRMALESQEDIIQLRQMVTSPGGTTEAAIQVFEKENLRLLFLKALHAANDRAQKLGETLGKS